MTKSSVIPSFLLAALEASTLGVRVVCRSENCIGISRCPFAHVHHDAVGTGVIIVLDPEFLREELLVCAVCGRRPAHEVLRVLGRQTVLVAFVRWQVELNHPQSSSGGVGPA